MSAFSVQKFKTEASMATVRGSRFVTVLAVALLGGFIVLASDTSFGQEKHKISWSAKPENTKTTFRHRLEIPDMLGHYIVMFEIRRTWPDGGGPVVEGRKVVESIGWGTFDGVAGNGLDRGYSVWRFENGDQSFGEFHDTTQSVVNPDRSRRATYVGTYVITGGTGKLKALKGIARYSGLAEYNAEGNPTRNEYSAEGEYWFEK